MSFITWIFSATSLGWFLTQLDTPPGIQPLLPEMNSQGTWLVWDQLTPEYACTVYPGCLERGFSSHTGCGFASVSHTQHILRQERENFICLWAQRRMLSVSLERSTPSGQVWALNSRLQGQKHPALEYRLQWSLALLTKRTSRVPRGLIVWLNRTPWPSSLQTDLSWRLKTPCAWGKWWQAAFLKQEWRVWSVLRKW